MFDTFIKKSDTDHKQSYNGYRHEDHLDSQMTVCCHEFLASAFIISANFSVLPAMWSAMATALSLPEYKEDRSTDLPV